MSYKAVLFDMDGTLLDTLEDLRDSTNHVLRQMGYPERSLEEMRRFVGNGAEKQIRRAVPEGTNEEKIMETLAAYRAYYQDHCQIKTRVYDGLLDMLNELKAKGIKLAVVSNKPDSAVQKLSREYFGDRMDFAVGPSDGVRCKPYPDMAETALKALEFLLILNGPDIRNHDAADQKGGGHLQSEPPSPVFLLKQEGGDQNQTDFFPAEPKSDQMRQFMDSGGQQQRAQKHQDKGT